MFSLRKRLATFYDKSQKHRPYNSKSQTMKTKLYHYFFCFFKKMSYLSILKNIYEGLGSKLHNLF